MSMVGGFLVFQAPEEVLSRVLGAFLLAYVVFILVKGRFKLPETTATALLGGALYGLIAGVFGVGGAVRGAFLAAYDLPKEVYIFTAGAIGLAIDTGRLATYWWQGAQLDDRLLWGLLLFVPVSFVGAKVAERIVERIPQERFRAVIATLLALIAPEAACLPVGERDRSGKPRGTISVYKLKIGLSGAGLWSAKECAKARGRAHRSARVDVEQDRRTASGTASRTGPHAVAAGNRHQSPRILQATSTATCV